MTDMLENDPAVWEKRRGIYYPVAIPTTAVSIPLALAGDVLVGGFSVVETTKAASADVDLIDGSVTGGTLIANITLNAGQSVRDLMPGRGVLALVGVFLVVNSGSVRGSVWVTDK